MEFGADGHWATAAPGRKSDNLTTTGFGRNDGRYLTYGEVRQLTEVYASTREWTLSQGSLVNTYFASLKFIASAESKGVLVTPRLTMREGWDGRWFNLQVSYAITLWLLYRINHRKASAYFSASKPPVVAAARSPLVSET